MARQIVCPSGLALSVRGLKGKEANLFTNAALHRKGIFIDKILNACVEEVVDAGPYEFAGGDKVNWARVLTGDRYYAIVQIRAETYGPVLEFSNTCSACGAKMEMELNLDTDLQVTPLPEDRQDEIDKGSTITLPESGSEVRFHLQTGGDEHRSAARMRTNRSRAVSVAMATRIDAVAGVENNDKLKWVEDLDMKDVVALMAAMEAADCGIETSIKEDCEACYTENTVEVPLSSADFWLPKASRKS